MARYALVIGITRNHESLGTLEKSETDARAIAVVLQRDGGFQVDLVIRPEETTGNRLATKLTEFLTVRALRHEALIYYTGHGFPLKDGFGEVAAFLGTSDCVVEWGTESQVVRQQNGLSLTSVSRLAARAELSNLVMLLDCCHSGAVLEESVLKQTFAGFVQKDYWLMTACRSFELAYVKRSEKYSVFTGAVLASLERERADERGVITIGELFSSVAKALRDEPQEVMQLSVGRPIELVRFQLEVIPIATIDYTNPYQGLRAFTKETAKFFFGRDRVVNHLVRSLQGSKFVPLIGASGSGKSSVVRAGVVPRLEELGWRVLEPIVPGVDPIENLRSAISDLNGSTNQKTLLVIDQFEEIFTLSRDREVQSAFIQELMALSQKMTIVVTMRADFVEDCLADEALTRLIQRDAIFLGAMTGTELEDAIVEPVAKQGSRLQERLLARILKDVESEENCLPLLEFALSQLWEMRSGAELTIANYEDLGGVMGALNTHAENIYKQLALRRQEQWVKRVILRLVRTGEGMRDTRQRQLRSDLLGIGKDAGEKDAIEVVINDLVNGRLLVSDRVNGQDLIDLSHEALMRSWKRFVDWRSGDRDLRRLAQRIQDCHDEWQEEGEDEDFLIRSGLLKQAQSHWLELYPALLRQPISEFYNRSVETEQSLTSYYGSINKFKENLHTMQNSLSERLKSIENLAEETLKEHSRDITNIHIFTDLQDQITNFMNQTTGFEARIRAAGNIAEWIDINYERIILTILNDVSSKSSVLDFDQSDLYQLIKKESRKLIIWLKRSLVSGQMIAENRPNLSETIPREAYIKAFSCIKTIQEYNSLGHQEDVEFQLYVNYMSDILKYID